MRGGLRARSGMVVGESSIDESHTVWVAHCVGHTMGIKATERERERERERCIAVLRFFYGCSYRLHLSGDNSRNPYVSGPACQGEIIFY